MILELKKHCYITTFSAISVVVRNGGWH